VKAIVHSHHCHKYFQVQRSRLIRGHLAGYRFGKTNFFEI